MKSGFLLETMSPIQRLRSLFLQTQDEKSVEEKGGASERSQTAMRTTPSSMDDNVSGLNRLFTGEY